MVLGLAASVTMANPMLDPFGMDPMAPGEGIFGFGDLSFLASALLSLTLASVLGAAIAYHPRHGQTADTIEEIEAPKVYIVYSAIGALIGIIVVKYGLAVGFVLFGIGGLIRVRTIFPSATMTGNLIFVTLIGLACGLQLTHVAVLATAFAFVLIYILDSRVTYLVEIKALHKSSVADSAAAYRSILEQQGCEILSEKKNPKKARVTFIFRSVRGVTRTQLQEHLEAEIDESLQGSLDWQVD